MGNKKSIMHKNIADHLDDIKKRTDLHNKLVEASTNIKYGDLPKGSWIKKAINGGNDNNTYIKDNKFYTKLQNLKGGYVNAEANYIPGREYDENDGKLILTDRAYRGNLSNTNNEKSQYKGTDEYNVNDYLNTINRKDKYIKNIHTNLKNNIIELQDTNFDKGLDKLNKLNRRIMNKDKLIIENNKVAKDKELNIKILKTILTNLFVVLSVIILYNLKLFKQNVLVGIIIAICIINIYFINKIYAEYSDNKENIFKKMSALSAATAKSLAKTAGANILPHYMVHKQKCPEGCKKKSSIPSAEPIMDPTSYQIKTDYALNSWLYGDPVYTNKNESEISNYNPGCSYYNKNRDKIGFKGSKVDINEYNMIIPNNEILSKSQFKNICKSRYGCFYSTDGEDKYCLKPLNEPTPSFNGVTQNNASTSSYLCKWDGNSDKGPIGNIGELVDNEKQIYKTSIPCKYFPGFSYHKKKTIKNAPININQDYEIK